MKWVRYALGGLLLVGSLSAIPQISGVYVNPNPFSPNGDGRADTTHIGFNLSGPAYIRLIVEGSPPDTLLDSTLVNSGPHSLLWDGAGYSDGSYTLRILGWDTLGNPLDTITSVVVIDNTPPSISDISAVPNPFSPNDDGIDDYLRIEFTASNTGPEGYDDYLLPSGRIATVMIVGTSSGNETTIIPDNSPTMPPFPVYLAVQPVSFTIEAVNLHFVDWSDLVVDVTVEAEPAALNRVGGLANKFDRLTLWADELTDGDTVIFYVYAFTGNATVTILDSVGNMVYQDNLYETFDGDDTYSTLWGPGPVPDGEYTYKIYVEDDAYNVAEFIGTVIANSVPTTLYDLDVYPSAISPENHDGHYDVASISYTLSEDALVTIRIYNSPSVFDSTTLVRTLLVSEPQSGGIHSVSFDGKNDDGEYLASGTDSTYTIVINLYDPLTGDGFQTTTEIEVDNEAPAAPELDTLSLATPTSDSTGVLDGFCEPGCSVVVYRNGDSLGAALADTVSGYFTFEVTYEEGLNYIYAVPVDPVSNIGESSDTLTVLYDKTPPYLVMSIPSESGYYNDTLSEVVAVLGDVLSGVDLGFSDIVLIKDGMPVSGSVVRRQPDTLAYVLSEPLVPGGDDDGVYEIDVEMRDSAGNIIHDTLYFKYDTRAPEMTVEPEDSSCVRSLEAVALTLSDTLSGIVISSSSLTVVGPQGELSGEYTTEYNYIEFTPTPPLSTDGSEDGTYYVIAVGADSAGNVAVDTTVFIYDTWAPQVEYVWPSDSLVAEPLARVYAVLSDENPGREGSGVDMSASIVRLYSGDELVLGQQSVLGDTVFWELVDTLDEDGWYRVYVRVVDRAGNFDSVGVSFLVDLEGPEVVRSYPGDGGYVTGGLGGVSVVFDDGGGSGVDSVWVEVVGPGGQTVPGSLVVVGDSVYYGFLVGLPEDGSVDGSYGVVVGAYDGAGWGLEPVNPCTLGFVYDTRGPEVVEYYPEGLVALGELDTVWVRVEDATSGVDLMSSTIVLKVGGEAVSGEVLRRPPDTLMFVVAPEVLAYLSNPEKSRIKLASFGSSAGILSLEDGEFYIVATVVDSAGNITVDSSSFILDRTPPVITVIPEDSAVLKAVDSVVAYISDALTGPDMSNSTLSLEGPTGAVSGNLTANDSSIIFTPYPPLRTDGSDDGRYHITIIGFDMAGNADTLESTFLFDTRPPVIVSRYPDVDATVGTEVSYVWILPTDSVVAGREPSGVNYQATEVYLLTEDGDTVPGTKELRGDTLYFSLSTQIAEGGTYTVLVRLMDQVFNEDTISWNFLLDISAPYVSYIYPEQSSYYSDTLSEIIAVLVDPSKSGINPDTSVTKIELYNPHGQAIAGINTLINDTLKFTLASPILPNGALDGLYTVLVYAEDLAGHELIPANPDTFTFIMDSRPPRVVDTYPDSGAYGVVPQDSVYAEVSDLYAGISNVSGIDFTKSYILLFYPDSTGVPGYMSYNDYGNGEGMLVWHIDPEADLPGGEYTMQIHLEDRAGHAVDEIYTFNVPDRKPVVISTSPSDGSIVNTLIEVSAVVLDRTGAGIDTAASYIKLYDPTDSLIPGVESYEAQDSIWTFILTLQSQPEINGTYRIRVYPVALDSTAGDVYEASFIFDSWAPQVIYSNVTEGDTFYSTPDTFIFTFSELSGIDTSRSCLKLWDPAYDSVQIDWWLSTDTIFVKPKEEFSVEGMYHLFRMIYDYAGNVLIDTFDFYFTQPLSAVTFIKPVGQDTIRVNYGDTVRVQVEGVLAVVSDRVGAGLQSVSVHLTKGTSDTLEGVPDTLNDTTFAWYLTVPLATDGSDNGIYYIIVDAKNALGDTLLVKTRFLYLVDTVPPLPPRDVDIPERITTDTLTITGRAEPFTLVMLYVNSEFRDSTRTSMDSVFRFEHIQLTYGIPNEIWLIAMDDFGNTSDTAKFTVFVGPPEFEVRVPKPMNLENNKFYISLPKDATVKLWVYNLAGDFVWRTEVSLTAGVDREIVWDGLKNMAGSTVKNGMYLYVIEARYIDGTVQMKKDFFAVVQ